MAYNDSYYTQGGGYGAHGHGYNQQEQHPTYDRSGYDRNYNDDTLVGQNDRTKDRNGYGQANYSTGAVPEDTRSIRQWRKDQYARMWTKGGRGRCFLRFCGCTFFNFIFLLLSILFTLALYIRPPNVTINNAGLATNGSAFQVTSTSLNLNLAANISVANPNYFSVSFKNIKLSLTYPINNMNIGGGEQDNIVFHSNSQSTFQFPITLSYNESADPNKVVLQDLLSKCGITGGSKKDITVNYQVTLGIRALFVTLSPTVSNKFSFTCPVTASDLSSLLKGTGINLGNLTG